MLSKNIKFIILFFAVLFLACNVNFAENNVKNKIYSDSPTSVNKEITALKNSDSNNKNNISISSLKSSNSQKIFAAGDDSPSSLSQASVLSGSNAVSNYVNKYGKLPNYVVINNYKFSMPEFLYLSAKTIVYKYYGSSVDVTIKYNIKNPTNPSGVSINRKILKETYFRLGKNVANFIDNQEIAPNFASSFFGKIQYQTVVYGFSKILSYTYTYKKLPNYLATNIKSTNSLNKYIPSYIRTNIPDTGSDNTSNENSGYPTKISQSSILSTSSTLRKYIDNNGKLPNYITISGKKYSMPEFAYLLAVTIVYKHDGSASDISVKYDISNPTNPFGNSISVTMNKNSYYGISVKLFSYISQNNRVPNYVSSQYGKIQYQTIVFGLAKIGDYYNKNKKLPSFLGLNVKSSHSMNKYLPNFVKN